MYLGWVWSDGGAIKKATSVVKCVDITTSWTVKSGQYSEGGAKSVRLCFGLFSPKHKQVMEGEATSGIQIGHGWCHGESKELWTRSEGILFASAWWDQFHGPIGGSRFPFCGISL